MILAALAAAAPARSHAQGNLQKAREAAKLGSESRALGIAISGLRKDPADRELFLFAVELLPEKKTRQASELAAIARANLKKSRDDFAWYLGLCKALRVSGRVQEAVADCRKSLELDPSVYPPYRELGLSYAAAGDGTKAVETLQQGAEISPSCKALYFLAKALDKAGDSAEARRSYKTALTLAACEPGLEGAYCKTLAASGMKRLNLREAAAKPLPPARKPGRENLFAGCLAKFRDFVSGDTLLDAADQAEKCARLDRNSPVLPAELAPVLTRLGKYEKAVEEYQRAASLYGPKAQQTPSLRIKAAELWIKLHDRDKAAEQYRLALAAAPLSLTALKSLAALMEEKSDFKAALDAYEAIIKIEPSNRHARTRADELRTAFMTNDQILEELHFRNALPKGQTVLQPEDIRLFRALRAAEISGGVDFVREYTRSARGLFIERRPPEGIKILLTGAGYKSYVDLSTREAIRFFEKQKIGLREIFKLRDLSGEALFEKNGKLTPEGAEVWRKGQAGKKSWLLSYEAVPESPRAVQANKEIAEAQSQGYREISEPEYLWFTRATNCPEDVLKKEPLNLKHISDGARVRYLLCMVQNSACINSVNIKLIPYIEDYRSGHTEISDSGTSTNFFGTGGVKKFRFCEKGRIWGGPS